MGSFLIAGLILLSTLSIGLEGVLNRHEACRRICGNNQHQPPTMVVPWARSYGYDDGGLSGRANDDVDLIPPPPRPGETRPTGPLPTTGGDDGMEVIDHDTGPTGGEVGGPSGGPDITGELNFNWDTTVGWNTTIRGGVEGGREHIQNISLDNGGYSYDKDWLKWQVGFETNPHITSTLNVKGGLKFGNVGGRRKRRRRRDLGKRF